MSHEGDTAAAAAWCAQLRRRLTVGLSRAEQADSTLRCLVSWLDRTVPPEPASVQLQECLDGVLAPHLPAVR